MKYFKYLCLCAVFCFAGSAFGQNVCNNPDGYNNCIAGSNNLDTICRDTCNGLFQNCLDAGTDTPTCKANRADCRAGCDAQLQTNYDACFGFYCFGDRPVAGLTSGTAAGSSGSTSDACSAAEKTEPMSRPT
jgi:hypothetical protein